MHKLILLVRELRQKGVFKVSTRLLLIFLMVLGFWVATMPLHNSSLPQLNDKFVHVIVFFCFAVLSDLTTARKPFWLWKGLPLVAYGLLIEISQSFTTYRSFELADLAADTTGIGIYYLLKFWVRRRDIDTYKI